MSCVLAVDPGTGKCGLALVALTENQSAAVLWRSVCSTSELEDYLYEAIRLYPPDQVVVGNGTGSEFILRRVRTAVDPLKAELVDERDTTLLAREYYWRVNRRRGWRKLIPQSMQVPPEPYDDFVAIILAERALIGMRAESIDNDRRRPPDL